MQATAPARDTVLAYLEVRPPKGDRAWAALRRDRSVVGRADDADIRLPSDSVSRRHAEILRDPFGRWWVRDLGSRNGIRINGAKVPEGELHAGDVLRISRFQLTFRPPLTRPGLVAAREPVALPVDEEPAIEISTLDEATTVEALTPMKVEASHLCALVDFGRQLGESPESQGRAELLCRLLARGDFHSGWAMVLRVRRDEPERSAQVLCEARPQAPGMGVKPYVSWSLVRKVLATGAPVLGSNARMIDGATTLTHSPDAPRMSAVACPLRGDGRAVDLLYVAMRPECGTAERLALASLAVEQYQQAEGFWQERRRTAAAARIEQDIRQAREIQDRLVPRDRATPGLEVAIGFEPCRWVGGDYVDVLEAGGGRWFLTVADVCGKGLQAALVSASVHAMVHALAPGAQSLGPIMNGLNLYLADHLQQKSFMTMVGLLLDPRTGSLEYANAGHPGPLILDSGRELRPLPEAVNPPLGLADSAVECSRGELAAGDVLCLFTDGLTELVDEEGAMLGSARLGRFLQEIWAPAPELALKEAAGSLRRRLGGFAGNALPCDDQTFLLARRA